MNPTDSPLPAPWLWLALLASLLSVACAGPVKELYPPAPEAPQHSVYVVSHGWHTGLVLRVADLPAERWPEQHDFAAADYLEIGWGDRDYYQADDARISRMLRAALWPGPGVLHVVGIRGPVARAFPASDIIELRLSTPGLQRLIDFIDANHARDGAKRASALGPGLYGNSRFYASGQRFHLLRTCNVWTAQALRAAGLPLTPTYAITTGNLWYQLRALAVP